MAKKAAKGTGTMPDSLHFRALIETHMVRGKVVDFIFLTNPFPQAGPEF